MDTTSFAQYVTFFLFGMFGAILFVLIAKQEVVPEFRPLYDVADISSEIGQLKKDIAATVKQIDELQAEAKSVAMDRIETYRAILDSAREERDSSRMRLSKLEREVQRNQIFMRITGFVSYIVLGGVFGAILSNTITVEGLNESLSVYLKPMAIGATWTSILATIGFSFAKSKADDQVSELEKTIAQKFEDLKQEIGNLTATVVSRAEVEEAKKEPVMADKTARDVEQIIASTIGEIRQDFAVTRSNVRNLLR